MARQTGHFKFYGDKEAQPVLDKVAPLAEAHFNQLCGSLGACDKDVGPIDVWLAGNAEALAANFKGISAMTACAAGVAFLDDQRVILRAQPGASMTVLEAFDHELCTCSRVRTTPPRPGRCRAGFARGSPSG